MNKGTRYKKESKNSNKKIIAFILLLLFITLFIFSGIKIINYIKDSKKNEKVFDDIAKDIIIVETQEDNNYENSSEDNKYKIDFESLKQKNSDTVGFVKVNGTDIEHIVVKGKDNDYYLHHNFNKESNSAGWIFANYRNKLDGTDKNIIVYGHNMRNDTMFGTLKNILNKDWQENEDNRYITFITENENSKYEVFSVYQIEAEDYYMKTDFNSGEFKKYITSMKSRSRYDFNVDLNEDDQILTLSTCANNNKYRVILHAKKIK